MQPQRCCRPRHMLAVLRRRAAPRIACAMASTAADRQLEKQAVRKRVKEALRGMSEEQMARESAAVAERMLSFDFLRRSQRLAVYIHCERLREVDSSVVVDTALQQGTRCYVPRVLDKDANMHFLHLDGMHALRPAPPFGIREPLLEYGDGTPREDALETDAPLDLIVMPGLGFSRDGHRLGRGGGYYDKFIEACHQRAAARGWERPLLVALAYTPQLLDWVPLDEHDHPVDLLVTAEEVIRCSERGRLAR